MRCSHGGENATADFPNGFDSHSPRRKRPHEIVEDGVRDGFVERAFIAERPDVHLEAFEFDEKFVGHIGDANRREIRLTGDRTQTGQFVGFAEDLVVTPLLGIRDSDEFL